MEETANWSSKSHGGGRHNGGLKIRLPGNRVGQSKSPAMVLERSIAMELFSPQSSRVLHSNAGALGLSQAYLDKSIRRAIIYPLTFTYGYFMTQNTLGKKGIPLSLQEKMAAVGQQIKLARKRRGLSMQEVAERMFVTRKTLKRLEDGEPGVSFGILASALLILGLEDDLDHLARPETDRTANIIDRRHYDRKKRIRPTRGEVDMDF